VAAVLIVGVRGNRDMSGDRANRVAVFGLDGLTFDLVMPWIDSGELPNLRELIRGGVSGELESTFSPVTAPAWTSFGTGANPGKHGVFDWQKPMRESLRRGLVTSRDVCVRTIWDIAGCNGRKVGLLNVPMTYPPKRVNGFLVSGMLTPDLQSDFAFPPSVRSLVTGVNGYRIDVRLGSYGVRDVSSLLQDLTEMTLAREKAALLLYEEYRPDFFMVVFVGPDRLQHRLWHYLDPSHPHYSEARALQYLPRILGYYRELDSVIGRLRAALADDTVVMIMSDHGFGPMVKWVDLNGWLFREGLLGLRDLAKGVQRILPRLHLGLGLRKKTLLAAQLLRGRRRKAKRMHLNSPESLTGDTIDWRKTRAYAGGSSERGVFLNVASREPMGIVAQGREYDLLRAELCRSLMRLTDSETGECVFTQVSKREDVYCGPQVGFAPDVVFSLKDGYEICPGFLTGSDEVVYRAGSAALETGSHRSNGVFILSGPGVRTGHAIRGIRMIDLAPLVLYSMGIQVPSDMDGQVRGDIFETSFWEQNPPQCAEPLRTDDSALSAVSYSEDENEEIRDRLRGLGYIE